MPKELLSRVKKELNIQDMMRELTLLAATNPIESLNATIKRKTKFKGSFPTEASALKVMYLATQKQQNKWNTNCIRNWHEIYPQLCIFFSEIMAKYTK